MKTTPELLTPLQFLILTLQKQLQSVVDYIETGEKRHLNKSLQQVDYIENYHAALLNQSAKAFLNTQAPDQPNALSIQCFEMISNHLKTLSNQLQQLATELQKPKMGHLFKQAAIGNIFLELARNLNLVRPAILSDDSQLAIELCQLETRLEHHANPLIKKTQKRLASGQNIATLLNGLFVVKDLCKTAEPLRHIGEAIISSNLGQLIQIDRYHTLQATLNNTSLPTEDDLKIHAMGETKSGCSISGLRHADLAKRNTQDLDILAIFKEGNEEKLQEEKLGIESWHKKYPGIAPEVYAFHQRGDKAGLLFEYMQGETFDKLILREDIEPLQAGLNRLFKTLADIWQTTQIKERRPALFMEQLKSRLNSIYAVHPEFNINALSIGQIKKDSLETLIQNAAKLEAKLKVPRAIFVHGDFNIDNIIYDAATDQLSFIDLHRSEYSDFVQDLSVLIVSYYRLCDFDPTVRHRISQTMQAIYDFGERYAQTIDDATYGQRMALGLARSFISSTRFILDKTHAKTMHFKGRFLIEQVLAFQATARKDAISSPYQVPKEIFND